MVRPSTLISISPSIDGFFLKNVKKLVCWNEVMAPGRLETGVGFVNRAERRRVRKVGRRYLTRPWILEWQTSMPTTGFLKSNPMATSTTVFENNSAGLCNKTYLG